MDENDPIMEDEKKNSCSNEVSATLTSECAEQKRGYAVAMAARRESVRATTDDKRGDAPRGVQERKVIAPGRAAHRHEG